MGIILNQKIRIQLNNKNIKIFRAVIKDNDKNNFKLNEANIDLETNSLNGKI